MQAQTQQFSAEANLKKTKTFHKIKLGLNLNEHIDGTNIAMYPAVYVGSGVDLEFPLVLNARHVVMIDPRFANDADRQIIMRKVIEYGTDVQPAKKITDWHYHIEFKFDFGHGPEKTTVDMFAKGYEDYKSILPIGYLIEFNGRLDHSLYKSDLIEKLLLGGLIINNQESPLRRKLPGFNLNNLIFWQNNDSIDALEDRQASQFGLTTIRIPDVPFAVYQKTSENANLVKFANQGVN